MSKTDAEILNDEYEQQMLKDIHFCSEPAKTTIKNCLDMYREIKSNLYRKAYAKGKAEGKKAESEKVKR
jgi:hypothetical protein